MTEELAQYDAPTTAIDAFRPFQARLEEFRHRYEGITYNLDDPTQEKEARSDKYQIGRTISALDKAHSQIKGPLLEQVRVVDGARKAIKDQLLAIQGRIKSQIQARDDRLLAEAELVEAKIESITALAVFDDDPNSDIIRDRLEDALAVNLDSETYGSRRVDAEAAQRQTVATLNAFLVKEVEYEKDQAELSRLRKEREEQVRKTREDEVRREAAEQAKRTAEFEASKAINEAQQREEKAKVAKERAEREAKDAAEYAESQAKLAAERAEARRLEAIQEERERAEREAKAIAEREDESRRVAEKKASHHAHRAKVEREALEDITAVIGDLDAAEGLLDAVCVGEIRHVTINY